MARSTSSFVCQSCGTTSSKWAGKCESCGGWTTITEEGAAPPVGTGAAKRVQGRKFALEDLKHEDNAKHKNKNKHKHHNHVLRAVKNRFGPTDEIDKNEMTGKGLAEVANP